MRPSSVRETLYGLIYLAETRGVRFSSIEIPSDVYVRLLEELHGTRQLSPLPSCFGVTAPLEPPDPAKSVMCVLMAPWGEVRVTRRTMCDPPPSCYLT